MGDNNKSRAKSRRSFLSLLLSGGQATSSEVTQDNKKVKMLTADGKLVEVDKKLLDEAVKRFKATNQDIFNWMNNPSKEK